MIPLYTGIGGVRKETSEMSCGISGVKRDMSEMWAGINGVKRQIFSSTRWNVKYVTPEYIINPNDGLYIDGVLQNIGSGNTESFLCKEGSVIRIFLASMQGVGFNTIVWQTNDDSGSARYDLSCKLDSDIEVFMESYYASGSFFARITLVAHKDGPIDIISKN